jgi:hypothetical protein
MPHQNGCEKDRFLPTGRGFSLAGRRMASVIGTLPRIAAVLGAVSRALPGIRHS